MLKIKNGEKGLYFVVPEVTVSDGDYIGEIVHSEIIPDKMINGSKQTVLSITVELDEGEEVSGILFNSSNENSPMMQLIALKGTKPGKKLYPKSFVGLQVGVILKKNAGYLNIVGFFDPEEYSENDDYPNDDFMDKDCFGNQ